MLLGQVLQNLGDRTVMAETLVAMDDLPLMVEIETVGDQFGETMSDYAVGAVRRACSAHVRASFGWPFACRVSASSESSFQSRNSDNSHAFLAARTACAESLRAGSGQRSNWRA